MTERAPLNEQEQADLVAFLDGELTGAAARRIEARMSLEPTVRAEADAFKKTWDLLDLLPRAEPSPLFTSKTLQKLTFAQTEAGSATAAIARPWKARALGLGWAAALILATYAGFAGFSRNVPREPTERELVQDLRVLENKRLYDLIDDLEFLHDLDHPDLFGEEMKGS